MFQLWRNRLDSCAGGVAPCSSLPSPAWDATLTNRCAAGAMSSQTSYDYPAKSGDGANEDQLQQNITKGSLWIHGRCNSTWKLRRRELRFLMRPSSGTEVSLEKKKKKKKKTRWKGKGMLLGTQQGEEEEKKLLIVSHSHHQAFRASAGMSSAIVALLKVCAKKRDLDKGSRVHADIVKWRLLEKDYYVGSALINMYATCGALAKAQEVFDELPVRDVVTWTALIAGYAKHGHAEQALNCFEEMRLGGLSPNGVTFASILKACGSLRALEKGQEIHAEVARQGFLQKDVVIGTALVDMYAKCGALAKAQELFYELPVRNAVSWTALIAGYAQQGLGRKAIDCFEQMQRCGISPDAFTFACVLKACGCIAAVDKGQEVHVKVVRQGLLEKSLVVGNALLDMYAKSGALAKAAQVFHELPVRDVISWNALIAGYAQYGHDEEALHYFKRMQLRGLTPDAVTFACVLNACGSMGATEKGKEIHVEIGRQGLLEINVIVGNALVDMYGKCGELAEAQELFNELPVQNAISWNALMAGYAHLGEDDVVFKLFNKMIREGKKPDPVTFTTLLNTCSHSGQLCKGQMYFESMSRSHGIIPTLDHHNCMVDIFGRAGRLDKVVAVVKEMPVFADLSVWHTVLGACRKWGNLKLGRLAFEHAVQVDENDCGVYVSLCNIYGAAGMQMDADKLKSLKVGSLEYARKLLVDRY